MEPADWWAMNHVKAFNGDRTSQVNGKDDVLLYFLSSWIKVCPIYVILSIFPEKPSRSKKEKFNREGTQTGQK